MTIICALRDPKEGCTWIGSDTVAVNPDDELVPVGPKWIFKNGWALGFAGYHKHQQVVQPRARTLFDGLEGVEQLCRQLGEIFREEDFKRADDKLGAPFWGGWYIAVTAEHIWTLDSTLAAVAVDPFAAEGQGSQFAKGAWYATRNLGWSGERILKTSIGAACAHLSTCGGDAWIHRLSEGGIND